LLGLVSTAAGQVTTAFAGRLPTVVRLWPGAGAQPPAVAAVFPGDVDRRLGALRGVRAVGIFWRVERAIAAVGWGPATAAAPPGPGREAARNRVQAPVTVLAAEPGFLTAAGLRMAAGRPYTAWDQAHAQQVCLIGASAAKSLRIGSLRSQPAVFIDGSGCVLLGIIAGTTARPSLLRSVVLPTTTALADWGEPGWPAVRASAGAGPAVLIRTRPGAAGTVARQAPYAISPLTPHAYVVTVPGGPARLGDQVSEGLRRLLATLGWAGVVVGALLVALISAIMAARRLLADLPGAPAPGRAQAAERRRRTRGVLAEAAAGGLLGGLAGAGLGVALVVGVGAAMHWAPVIAPVSVLPAPLAGLAAAVCGALAAAARASWAARARR
jgi:putative ABC transport system permease protein